MNYKLEKFRGESFVTYRGTIPTYSWRYWE